MHLGRTLSRAALLVLTLLSACAASDLGPDDAPGVSSYTPSGAFGDYLVGRFAEQNADLDLAARKLAAAARSSGVPEVETQAFLAAVLAGRPDATALAAKQPGNPVAQLILGDQDARAGRWMDAEARFRGLPQQGLTQVLRPLLIAWSQAGAKRTSAALGTLQPYLDGRLRGIMALHAALIADLGGQAADAARLYGIAQVQYGALNLRLGRILASWQARQGNASEAQRIVDALGNGNGDLAMARPALSANVAEPPVRNATDGIAEAYLAMAATLRQQNALGPAQLLLRLSLDMRPGFTPARLLLAEIEARAHRPRAAAATLAPVPASDPLIAVVQLRRAALADEMGQTAAAAQLLDTLSRDNPSSPEPLALEADMLRRKGRFHEAAAMYDRAIARIGVPSRVNWPLFYERGVAREQAGDWPKAEGDFEFALKLAPEQPSVLNYLGYAWIERGKNVDQATQMIRRAVALRPNEGAFIDSLGWALLRRGETAEAVTDLERAVDLQPEDAVINGHLGDALAAAGRVREAEFQWRRALTLKPDAAETQRIESHLAKLPGAPASNQAAGTAPNAPTVAKP